MKRLVSGCTTLVLLAACGSPTTDDHRFDPASSDETYRGSGTVLQEEGEPADLCFGLLESYPPQCGGGVRLKDWDWDSVDGEERASGTTWGDYEVTGRYDGETFSVTGAGPPREQSGDDDWSADTPCSPLSGGWESPDPEKTTQTDIERTNFAAWEEEDFSGSWVTQLGKPSEYQKNVVLNLAFTGDLDRHETVARETWGGPLCVVEFERTLARLEEIHDELREGNSFGLDITGSSIDETQNQVDIGVVAIDEETMDAMEARYGEGAVAVEAALRPI